MLHICGRSRSWDILRRYPHQNIQVIVALCTCLIVTISHVAFCTLPITQIPFSNFSSIRDGSMLNSSAANVIQTQLLADPVAYLRASYATWVIAAKAVTKAAAHVLQYVGLVYFPSPHGALCRHK